MMRSGNVKIALASLRASRWRSFLTMTGIIIGISSVVTFVSLGEGLKQQVVGEIDRLGKDLIIVRSGKIVNKDESGTIGSINPLAALSASTLSPADVEAVRKLPGVKSAVPMSLITNSLTYADKTLNNAFVIAAETGVPEALNQPVLYGGFFTADENNSDYAVIGQNIATTLFGELNPVGKSMTIEGREFIVRGVFEPFEGSALASAGTDFNSTVFIPYETGQRITEGRAQILQVLVKTDTNDIDSMVSEITRAVRAEHGGQDNFSVLKQEDLLQITNDILGILTRFISGIAAISLIVGGIGIMNIMLVSVSERTREIGIRKAVGATNRQILSQFLVEGTVLSVIGGVLGIVTALLISVILRIGTNFQPVITLPIIIVATFVSVAVGIVFSLAPAIKASNKDPIEALRDE